MVRKIKPIDYRALKKLLNPYVYFSFKMPRKGEDFDPPQQKSTITRIYRRLEGVLENLDSYTFIKYKKGKGKFKGVEGVRTNKGIFILEKNAKIKKDKILKKYVSYYKVQRYTFIDYTFPPEVLSNTDFIEMWVDYLIAQYGGKVYQVMWLRHGTRNGDQYKPELFYKYFNPNDDSYINFNKEAGENNTKIGSIIGVTLVFFQWEKRKREY